MGVKTDVPSCDRFVQVKTAEKKVVPCLLPRRGDGGWPYTIEMLDRIAQTDGSVLITGETGTGKELLAAYLHGKSRLARGPLVSVNCAGLTEERMQGELFGWRKGAFTGAAEHYDGKVAAAQGGTLLLDEIGYMDPLNQARLLRFMQTKRIERLGEAKPIAVDARVIAATNRPVRPGDKGYSEAAFLPDLFHRFDHNDLRLPPLRRRGDDMLRLFLAPAFLGNSSQFTAIRLRSLALMIFHDWPGNIRELAKLCDNARLFSGYQSDPHGQGQRVFAEDRFLPSDAEDKFEFSVCRCLERAIADRKRWGTELRQPSPDEITVFTDTACLLTALLPSRPDCDPKRPEQDMLPLSALERMLGDAPLDAQRHFSLDLIDDPMGAPFGDFDWNTGQDEPYGVLSLIKALTVLVSRLNASPEPGDPRHLKILDAEETRSLWREGFSFGGWSRPVQPNCDPLLEERLDALDLSGAETSKHEVIRAVLRRTSNGLSRSQTAVTMNLTVGQVKGIVARYGEGFAPSNPARGGRPGRTPGAPDIDKAP